MIFDEDGEPDIPPPPLPRATAGGGAAMLAAMMLGLGEVLEPDKTHVDIEAVADADDEPDDVLFDLHFGDLPPISPN